MSKPLPYKKWERILKTVPLVTIDVIIKDERGVLLVKREIDPFKGYWHIPGGFLRFGESFEEAALRIAKEELGLKVKAIKFLCASNLYKKDPRGHIINLAFLAKQSGGKLNESFQGRKMKFFKKIPNKTIYYHKETLNKIENS